MPQKLYAHGKVLLTAEYVVLDGALALALPVNYGQVMHVGEREDKKICWIARDRGEEWFRAIFSDDLHVLESNHEDVVSQLKNLLSTTRILSGQRWLFQNSCIITDTDYPRQWGLGSSATLVALTAAFGGVNPYLLQAGTFGGSGYDVACAFAAGPILYRRTNNVYPEVSPVSLAPDIRRMMYFIYSGRKQSSAEEVARYKKLPAKEREAAALKISDITSRLTSASTYQELTHLIKEHEKITGNLIQKEPLQETRFSDFVGVVKSLGAWGGDFFLACSRQPQTYVIQYFEEKGYGPVFNYQQFVYDKRRLAQRSFRLIL